MKSKIKQIIKFEFLRTAKTKGFIIGIILVPLLFLGSIAVTAFFAAMSNDHSEEEITIGVLTNEQQSTVFREVVGMIRIMDWKIVESADSALLRQMTFDKQINGYIKYDSVAGYSFYSDNYTDLYVSNTINGIVHNVNRHNEISHSGLSEEQVEKILNPPSVNTYKLSEEHPETAETSDVHEESFKRQMCGMAFAFLMLMSVMMFAQNIGQSVLEDKSTKIVDVLLTSVTPTQLLTGKIMGIGGAGLVQFLVWVLMAVFATNNADVAAIGSLSEFLTPQLFVLSSLYFVFGILTVMAVYAAIGSMAETQQHYNQLVSGISIFTSLPFIIITPVTLNPGSTFSVVMSMLPVFSSSLMPVRIIAGDVPVWQLLLSIVILVGTGFMIIKLAARIFRNGIMQQGKDFKFKDIFKLMKKA